MSPDRSPTSLLVRLRFALTLFALTLLIGTIGYMILLDLDPIRSFYFTVVTLSTTGYGEILPDSTASRLFTVAFLIGGLGIASYSAAIAIGAVVEGELRGALGHRRMIKNLHKLRDHTIICGLGRIGSDLAAIFTEEGMPFVVIEQDAHAFASGESDGYMIYRGDATDDDVLHKVRIEDARFIVTALASDADNLYIAMSARQMNPDLVIVTRATAESAAQKMERAGANRVIRPLHIGAQHMAQAVLRPTVLDFMRFSGDRPDQEFALEEIGVAEGSELVGKTLTETGMRQQIGVVIIGIKRRGGHLGLNPSGDTMIHAGDTLVALGSTEQTKQLAKLAGGPD